MKRFVLIALLALFSFGDLVYAQDSMTMQVVSERARQKKKNNTWGNWTGWVSSNAIIYCGLDDDGNFAFYYEDEENSKDDLYFVITYMSDSTFDNEGGEHATARITSMHSGNRGTLEWYTYPSGTSNLFTIKFPQAELQWRTRDL